MRRVCPSRDHAATEPWNFSGRGRGVIGNRRPVRADAALRSGGEENGWPAVGDHVVEQVRQRYGVAPGGPAPQVRPPTGRSRRTIGPP